MDVKFIKNIPECFQIVGKVQDIQPVGNGHIHHSFKVITTQENYFLQKINQHVFRNVPGMMENIAKVTSTLKTTLEDTGYETLEIVWTNEGLSYLISGDEYWRMYMFKSHLQTFETAPGRKEIKSAAKAYAAFVKGLENLDLNELHETIPKFHSMEYRINQFHQALALFEVTTTLEKKLKQEIALLGDSMLTLEASIVNNGIPLRVVHNDTKINNLLFDANGEARCVVDLDTVMMGIVHFDVGDALRTLSCPAREDEPDESLVVVDEYRYRAFLDAYLAAGSNFLTKKEIYYMRYAATYMAVIMAMRFFTDHLNGNIYFHCDYPTHNLIRARNQIVLARQFSEIENLFPA